MKKQIMVALACVAVAFLAFSVQPCAAGDPDNPQFKSVRSAWFSITSSDTANRFKINGTAVTADAAELNILDGCTATAGQLNAAVGVAGTGSVAASTLTGNVALARMTNAIATATGVKLTNTCVAADGKTNTYVFVPIAGGRYMLDSISTSP